MPQTTSTGNLAKAQRTMIGQMLYTTEHNAPAMALVTHMRLRRGASSVDVPKAGQMTVSDLVEGQDITDEQSLGMEFTTLTTSEVGAKVVVTDKLVRQMQPDVFKVIGRQLGDGMARKKDQDVIALYGSLNGGTDEFVIARATALALLASPDLSESGRAACEKWDARTREARAAFPLLTNLRRVG